MMPVPGSAGQGWQWRAMQAILVSLVDRKGAGYLTAVLGSAAVTASSASRGRAHYPLPADRRRLL